MTITTRVQQQFFSEPQALIRLPPTVMTSYAAMASVTTQARTQRATRSRSHRRTNLWTVEEHERFLRGLEQFPTGPWKEIAAMVGTKTTRQTMTHSQKYRQKIERRQRLASKHSPYPAQARRDTGLILDPRVVSYDSVGHALYEVSSPIHVGTDLFDSTWNLFEHDLYSFLDDLNTVPNASGLSLALSRVV